jgi:hypothetical protein
MEGRDRRKAYFETPPSAGIARDFALPPGARLAFVGIAAGEREYEYYFRKNFIEVAQVGRLLVSLSLREAFEPLLESVAATLPRPIHEELLPTDAGFSLRQGVFSVFTYARSIWGSDGFIRRQILELAEKKGWDFELYKEVTRPLESATDYCTHHGVLAWIAVPGRPVELRISVRPPD